MQQETQNERCPACFLKRAACICAEIPTVPALTHLVVVRHAIERFKTSNTGRLATMAIQGSRLVDHGTRESPVGVPLLRTLPAPVYLLYPDGEPPAAPPPGPVSLVVLDGSWPQARRMLQRIPEVRGLPRLSLPPPAAPRQRLRRGRDAGEMSTLEAIACAIAFLEGDAVAAPLFALHDLFVERSIPPHDRKRQANR